MSRMVRKHGYLMVTIVALSKYPDIFTGFQANVNEYAPGFHRILVMDGYLINDNVGWLTITGPKKFEMAGNANIGWKAAPQESDLLYIGDDVRFTTRGSIERLQELAYSDPSIGLLSPRILGGADNELQKNPPTDKDLSYSERYIPLICTYIKRKVINTVGYLDEETFKGCYGNDDADYGRRVKNAGFKLAITPRVEVTHGLNHKGTETFLRNVNGYDEDLQEMIAEHDRRYLAKWGDLNK